MAKKRLASRGGAVVGNEKTEDVVISPAVDAKIEEFGEDLGRLLGTAQSKAESWLGQRKAIAEHLVGVRDTATRLLEQLGIAGGESSVGKQAAAEGGFAPAPLSKKQRRKRRTMSPEAREKIAAAQRARWAKQKAAAKRG